MANKMTIKSLLQLPRDTLTVVASFLDRYDANNLRMVSKAMCEEVTAIQKVQGTFHRPVYTENEYGRARIYTSAQRQITIEIGETLGWKIDKSPRRKENKYIIYIYDDYGGWPQFFSDKAEWMSIITSYKACKEGRKFQRKFLEEKEERRKEEAKKIFVLKGSAAPTNPWKKFVSKV